MAERTADNMIGDERILTAATPPPTITCLNDFSAIESTQLPIKNLRGGALEEKHRPFYITFFSFGI